MRCGGVKDWFALPWRNTPATNVACFLSWIATNFGEEKKCLTTSLARPEAFAFCKTSQIFRDIGLITNKTVWTGDDLEHIGCSPIHNQDSTFSIPIKCVCNDKCMRGKSDSRWREQSRGRCPLSSLDRPRCYESRHPCMNSLAHPHLDASDRCSSPWTVSRKNSLIQKLQI